MICEIYFDLFCVWGKFPNIIPQGLMIGEADYRSLLRFEGLIFGILQ